MRSRKTKNVSLTPELEAFVAQKVSTGRYRTASEVVRAALRHLEQHEAMTATRRPDNPVGFSKAFDGAQVRRRKS